jgi:nucleotide-binding universal stress UspA family protein
MENTMGLKDILVHVDRSSRCEARLEAAINLAADHDAHLIGLYVLTYARIPGYIRAEINEDVLKFQAESARAAAEKAEAMFNEHVDRAGVKAEWRCVEGDLLPVLSLHARYADIAIVGQRDPEWKDTGDDPGMPDQLVLSIGRPVLVVPHVGQYPVIGKRVMVAWDASRLATRAVNDALPFLVKAKKVAVVAVNPEGGEEGHGEIPSADICLHLARHGVKAEAQHIYAKDMSVGDMMLSRAADEGIDLIVTGAYGHARWRELVLGGVTRHLLNHMTVPVLMSD